MTDRDINDIAIRFRSAIERARDAGEFQNDISFDRFPWACCGDTSYLLAEYLRSLGIETIWYSTMRGDGSHAWLVVKDDRVKEPTPSSFSWPEELRAVMASYGAENTDQPVDTTHYVKNDLKDGLMIDITADQFSDYDLPVYVGVMDDFHREFEFTEACDYTGLHNGRLRRLYEVILRYLK